ncbi:MAG: HD domain-containing protein [Deltaproteobacteria bacterium]
MSRELRKVAGQLPDFFKAGPVYLVGGSLRDRILGRPSNDYDFAVAGDAIALAKRAATRLGARVIQIGKQDKVVHRVVSGDKIFDFSPLKGETIDEDLRSRDFTMNGLGYDLASQRMIDPVGGLDDIGSRTIRLISEQAILADPIRMLRAFRLAAALEFEIARHSLTVIKKHAALIVESAAERIRAELLAMTETERSFAYLKQMADVGLLMKLIPELEPCRGCPADNRGSGLLEHLMRTYEEIETILREFPTVWPGYAEAIRDYLGNNSRAALLKWSGLLHDLGKPETQSFDSAGKVRYLGHEERGCVIARGLCLRLKMSTDERSYIERIVENHMHPLHLFEARRNGMLTTRGIARFARRHEDHIIGLLVHSLADQRAKAGHTAASDDAFVRFSNEILRRYFVNLGPTLKAPKLITGKDFIAHFGLKPSKLFGKLLHQVEEARLQGEISTREEAFELVERLLRMEGDAGIEPESVRVSRDFPDGV